MIRHKKLKQARKKLGMSLRDVELSLYKDDETISRQSILNWEEGTHVPKIENLQALAKVYNKDIKEFLQ